MTVILARHTDSYYNRTLELASVCVPRLTVVRAQADIGTLSTDDNTPISGFGTRGEDLAKEVVGPLLASTSLPDSVIHIAAPNHNEGVTGSYDPTLHSMFEAET